jgi:glycosidase
LKPFNASIETKHLGGNLRLTTRVVLLLALIAPSLCLCGQDLSFGSRAAKRAPEWLDRASIYEVWLNAFSKEANLKGATAQLKDVADLGASIVYLSPIAKHSALPQASPYSIADYNEIDPEYGTAQDLHDFVSMAHSLHLKVMLDVVYYHMAPDNAMIAKHPDLFVKTEDGKIARGFWPQPLPDFQNPQMRKYLIDSLLHWVRDFGVDGFRCDVGGGVPLAFWNEARQALNQVNPEVLLLSESDRPDDQLQAFDINYNFQYYLALVSVIRDGAPASKLRDTWELMHATMPQGARLLHYSDNHDWPRSVLEFGRKGAMAASILNFTLDGIPFVYNGQEVADPTATSWRTPVPIHWTERKPNANETQTGSIREQYKKLFAMRAAEPALTAGELTWINNTEPADVLSFLRKKGKSEVLVILNLSNRQVHVTIDLPVMDYSAIQNLLKPDNAWFQLYSGRVSTDLGAFEAIVGKKIPLAPLGDEK